MRHKDRAISIIKKRTGYAVKELAKKERMKTRMGHGYVAPEKVGFEVAMAMHEHGLWQSVYGVNDTTKEIYIYPNLG